MDSLIQQTGEQKFSAPINLWVSHLRISCWSCHRKPYLHLISFAMHTTERQFSSVERQRIKRISVQIDIGAILSLQGPVSVSLNTEVKVSGSLGGSFMTVLCTISQLRWCLLKCKDKVRLLTVQSSVHWNGQEKSNKSICLYLNIV